MYVQGAHCARKYREEKDIQLTIVSTTNGPSHRSTPTCTSGSWSPRTPHRHWAWQHAWMGWWTATSNLHHLHHPPFSSTKYFLFLFLVRRRFCQWNLNRWTTHLFTIQFTHCLRKRKIPYIHKSRYLLNEHELPSWLKCPIVCNAFFTFSVALCALFHLSMVCYFVWCVFLYVVSHCSTTATGQRPIHNSIK